MLKLTSSCWKYISRAEKYNSQSCTVTKMMNKNKSISPLLKSIGYKIGYYIQASRYEGGIVAAVFLLIGEWYSTRSFSFYSTIIAIFAVLGIVNSGSWINYICDRTLDRFAKKDTSFFKYISPKEMFLSSFILFLVSSVLLFYINTLAFLVGLLTFLVFLVYATPPVRLKTRPPFDAVANALGFGTMPFILGFTITGNQLTWTPIIQSVIAGLPVVSYYFFISLFDIGTDREYGIKTSCTRLGFNGTIIAGVMVFFSSILLSLLFFNPASALPLSLIICFPIILTTTFTKDILKLQKLISTLFLAWTGTALLLLSLDAYSPIPIAMFIIILAISLLVIYTYVKEKS